MASTRQITSSTTHSTSSLSLLFHRLSNSPIHRQHHSSSFHSHISLQPVSQRLTRLSTTNDNTHLKSQFHAFCSTPLQHLQRRTQHLPLSIKSFDPRYSIRQFTSEPHSRVGAVHAVTGFAFAGKPRTNKAEEEMQKQYAGNGEAPVESAIEKQARQGFPTDSVIGEWVDATLKKGEAGEDALLYQKMKGEGDIIIGVADGVGGWSENGIDPALFSQSLLYHSASYAKEFYACPERLEEEEVETLPSSSSPTKQQQPRSISLVAEPGTPLDILQYAFEKTQEQVEVPAGSATACIVTFDASKGMIRTANLGDSGFLILRPSLSSHEEVAASSQSDSTGLLTVHYQSKPQTHGFNTPLQLSKLPPEYRSQGSIDSKPSHADLWSGRVLDGDMVLVATDGFWDNVSVNEVVQLVKFIQDKHRAAFVDRMLDISNSPLAEEEDLADVLAHNLLSYALMCQFSANKTSPFEREAARHGIQYPGGKVDDVAIIVSLIIER